MMSQRKEERGAILQRRTKDDLPDEIVLEILARLPVKSLLRFRCVCKPWYSSIANPNFISTHLRLLNHNHHRGYVILMPMNVAELPSSIPGSNGKVCTLACDRTYETISDFRVPFTFRYGSEFVGSCNGILCFTSYRAPHDNSNFGYLWNPSIRKFKSLPDIQFRNVMTFGIGYDSQNNDFKVVGISRGFGKSRPPLEVAVYSLSLDSWKRVELGISLRPNASYTNCYKTTALPFVSGHLHWILNIVEHGGGHKKHSINMIFSFDVNSEKFKQLPLPDIDDVNELGSFITYITSFKGKLALCIMGDQRAQTYNRLCSFWVMREYGVIDSWNKLFVVSNVNYLDFHGFTRHGLLLIQKGPWLVNSEFKWKYVLIDPETLHEKEISIQANSYLNVAAYMESLALLDGRNVISY